MDSTKSSENEIKYTRDQQDILLSIAAKSIQHGLRENVALSVHRDYCNDEKALKIDAASFITLEIKGRLRGCIGSLVAMQPLISDVAHNAFSAAFTDTRFARLTEIEFSDLDIHLSILNPAKPMTFDSEDDLLSQLRPGFDGLILSDNFQRGTFLPSVWQSLPEANRFLTQLKVKAGFDENYWSNSLTIERYTTFSFAAHISSINLNI